MKMEGDWLTSSVAVLNLCCGLSQKCNSEILGKKTCFSMSSQLSRIPMWNGGTIAYPINIVFGDFICKT